MVHSTRILAFDFSPYLKLGEELKKILKCNPKFRFFLVGHNGNNTFTREAILDEIFQYNPQIIFLLFSSNLLKEIKSLIKDINKKYTNLKVVVIFEDGNSEEIFSILKSGITDFMTPPIKEVDVIPRILRLIRQIDKNKLQANMLIRKLGLMQLVGKNPLFIKEKNKIPVIAQCDSTVLILGETGTGKEMFARSIHYLSPRADQSFVPVNCGAIPVELIENELFGHIQGAYTGATTLQEGLINEANKGTLFLDEIDCLPLLAQMKLLRFMQDKLYRRLGSSKTILADVRMIAATNNNLKNAVDEGKFRRDLFYRLNIIPLTLPNLRERKDDIPILAEHFLFQYTSELNKKVTGFTPQAIEKLILYEWPGNIRELENVIHRAIIFTQDEKIKDDDIQLLTTESSHFKEPFKKAKKRAIEKFEINYIQNLLIANHGNISKAARNAGKNRRAFWELIRKYKIDVQNYKVMTS